LLLLLCRRGKRPALGLPQFIVMVTLTLREPSPAPLFKSAQHNGRRTLSLNTKSACDIDDEAPDDDDLDDLEGGPQDAKFLAFLMADDDDEDDEEDGDEEDVVNGRSSPTMALRNAGSASARFSSSHRTTPKSQECKELVVALPPMQTHSRSSASGAYPSEKPPLVKSGVTRSRLKVTFTSLSDTPTEVSIDLNEGELDGPQELKRVVNRGEPEVICCRSTSSVVGMLRIAEAEPIPFGIQVGKPSASGERSNFVAKPERQRTVFVHAGELSAGSGTTVKGEGVAVEVTVSIGAHADLAVTIRKAKKKELTRMQQQRSLQSAMEDKKYSTLLAQITKSKMRKVEAAIIEQANQVLKAIKQADGSFLKHDDIKKMMKWKRVTGQVTPAFVTECCPTEGCLCNSGSAQSGEICNVMDGAVENALASCGVKDQADKWLFKALVKAAENAPEGCLWKSGGKFLLTNEERNQSPTAIVNLLDRASAGGETDAGRGIRALVEHTEKEFGYRVTAVQLNFHPNEKSSHKQHRDIYGAGQKGGINCTCSFMKCTGTVCYSLGSSRKILTETIADTRSKYEACGDECQGAKTYRWMHSGSMMFFNAPWNNNHTHGVPKAEEQCGPRISIALLCA